MYYSLSSNTDKTYIKITSHITDHTNEKYQKLDWLGIIKKCRQAELIMSIKIKLEGLPITMTSTIKSFGSHYLKNSTFYSVKTGLDLSGLGRGVNFPSGAFQPPKFSSTPTGSVKHSQKYIVDPPLVLPQSSTGS